MNENQKCNKCKKTLEVNDFTQNGKIYKICNICRVKQNEKRRKNVCEECGIKGIFNFQNEIFGIRCKKHKEVDMIDVINPKCVKCKVKQSAFNFKGKNKPLYCKDCSEIGMINIKNPQCIKCKIKQPNYNYEGENKALYCKKCSEPDMINIKCPKCITCKQKQPVFNYETEKKALYCKDCSESDMIDIRNNKCIKCKKKRPTFNYEYAIKASYCKDCSEPDMIDIVNFKCIKCKKKLPVFNYKNEDKALYCKDCSELDMVDIRSAKCYCGTCASFGYVNQGKTHCAKHKLPLMFKITKPICEYENCKEIAEYGIDEPKHCFLHKIKNELCLLGKTCINCKRENELCNKDGLCLTYCRPVEVDLNVKKIIKKKEALVLSYLDKNVKFDIKPIDDRVIDTSCVKNRPDRVYDCGSHFVVVEIDENQHKSYTNGCSYDKKIQEFRRMVQIHEALSKGMIPVIFLRFNPDNFRVEGKLQKVNMQKRLEMLEKWLQKCVNINIFKYKQNILIKHLFYDEYNETNVNFTTIKNISKLI